MASLLVWFWLWRLACSRSLSIEFPERPGALHKFLHALPQGWNISMFHYRNHGAGKGLLSVIFLYTATHHSSPLPFTPLLFHSRSLLPPPFHHDNRYQPRPRRHPSSSRRRTGVRSVLAETRLCVCGGDGESDLQVVLEGVEMPRLGRSKGLVRTARLAMSDRGLGHQSVMEGGWECWLIKCW